MKKIIGIDIDKTLCSYNSIFYDLVSKQNNYSSKKETKPKELSDTEIKSYLEKESNNKILKILQPENYPIYPHAKETIDFLKSYGYKIYLISSRPSIKPIIQLTTKWLEINDIAYDKLILNCKNKAQQSKKLEVDFFIDDNENYIDDFLRNEITPIIFKAEQDNSTNHIIKKIRDFKMKKNKYFIFKSWEEIKEYLKKDFEKNDFIKI